MDQETAISIFASLAQSTRMSVFRLLVNQGPDGLPVLEISRRLGVVPSTLSGHLATLRRAGILSATRHQKEIHYAADLRTVNRVIVFLLADCCNGQVENCGEILSLLGLQRPQASKTR